MSNLAVKEAKKAPHHQYTFSTEKANIVELGTQEERGVRHGERVLTLLLSQSFRRLHRTPVRAKDTEAEGTRSGAGDGRFVRAQKTR